MDLWHSGVFFLFYKVSHFLGEFLLVCLVSNRKHTILFHDRVELKQHVQYILCPSTSTRFRRKAGRWSVRWSQQYHLVGVPAAKGQAAGPLSAADQEKHWLRANIQPDVPHRADLLLQFLPSHKGYRPRVQVRSLLSVRLFQWTQKLQNSVLLHLCTV